MTKSGGAESTHGNRPFHHFGSKDWSPYKERIKTGAVCFLKHLNVAAYDAFPLIDCYIFFIRCSFFLHTFLLRLLTFSIFLLTFQFLSSYVSVFVFFRFSFCLLTFQLCPHKSQHLSSLQHFPIIVLQKSQKQAFYLRHFQWLFAIHTTYKHATYHV